MPKPGRSKRRPVPRRSLSLGKVPGKTRRLPRRPVAVDPRFRLLVENSYDSLVLIGEDATVLYASPSLPRVIGYAVEEFVGRNIFEFVHPEDLDRTRGLFARCLENPETPIRCECRYRHKDDSWRDLEAVGVNRLLDPEIGAVIANFRDVTERRQAESALRDSEERFRAFVETSADWVWACDPAGIMTYSNAAVVNILGYRQEELQNADSFDWLHPEDCAPSRALLDDCVARKIGWRNFTIRWRHRDGTYRDMESTGVPVLDAAGEVVGFRGVDRDITERRRLEGQLRQSQKMEAVGRLAGGVAHDFNNLLTAILGYARLLLGRAEPGPDWRQEIQEIQAAAQRAADLTQQLLAFGRRQVLVLEVLDLGAVVAGMTRMLQRMVGDGVTLQVVAGPEKCCVRAGRAQIEQVLMNLAMNARDAMPAGGTLTVAVREAVLDAAFVRDHPGAQAGTWALLSVRDTGTGIDAAIRSHLFEPFFTTKTVGKGTGLGLATVYGIVKQSGGYIAVESRPGEGTEFQVYLPRGAAQVSVDLAAPGVAEPGVPAMTGAKSRTAEAENRPGDPETILVIEDDRAVRLLVREILEAAGYRVLDAPGGQEALRLADEHDGPIHLLLVDVIMPGMSGREVADRMAAVRPGVPTLYMSGYTDDAIVRHGVAVRDVDFIQKPFTPDALARRVRAALDRTAARNAA